MLIAISKYLKPLSEIDQHRAAHVAYFQPYFNSGKLLLGGRQNPPRGGIIISNTLTKAEFENLIANDPYTKAGLAEYELTEFNPAMYHNALNNLFNS